MRLNDLVILTETASWASEWKPIMTHDQASSWSMYYPQYNFFHFTNESNLKTINTNGLETNSEGLIWLTTKEHDSNLVRGSVKLTCAVNYEKPLIIDSMQYTTIDDYLRMTNKTDIPLYIAAKKDGFDSVWVDQYKWLIVFDENQVTIVKD